MFWHLLLAHFIADYPFQPTWIIKNKCRWWALFAHASTHFVVTIALLGLASRQTWPYILGMSVIHYVIDWTKIQINTKNLRPVGLYYGLDQVAHYIVIAFTTALIYKQEGVVSLPFDDQTIIYLTGFLLVTYVWYITELVVNSDDDKYQRELNAQYWPRMVVRGAYLALLLIFWNTGGWPGLALGAVIPFPYRAEEYRARAMLTDLSAAVGVAIFIQAALK